MLEAELWHNYLCTFLPLLFLNGSIHAIIIRHLVRCKEFLLLGKSLVYLAAGSPQIGTVDTKNLDTVELASLHAQPALVSRRKAPSSGNSPSVCSAVLLQEKATPVPALCHCLMRLDWNFHFREQKSECTLCRWLKQTLWLYARILELCVWRLLLTRFPIARKEMGFGGLRWHPAAIWAIPVLQLKEVCWKLWTSSTNPMARTFEGNVIAHTRLGTSVFMLQSGGGFEDEDDMEFVDPMESLSMSSPLSMSD